MRIESKLCHVTEDKAVVQVTAWLNEKSLGSTLAEGPTVEVAEDKAISRLYKRINAVTNYKESVNSTHPEEIKNPIKIELPQNDKTIRVNTNNEPSDWSNELTAIDTEIKRLKWSRDDEIIFLEKNLGYNNRNKITNYNDIVRYLSLLKKKDMKNQFNLAKENIKSLIDESDNILKDLSWNHVQGREYLKREFNVSTRKELNEKQLISFVDKLKSIRNQYQPR